MFNNIFRFFSPQAHPVDIKQKYHLPDSISLNIELTKDGWYVADSPDLPGLFTQARNQKELLNMINDAVLTYFDVPKQEADYIYDQIKIGGQTIRYQAKLQTA